MEPLQYTSLAHLFFANCDRENFAGWSHRKHGKWINFTGRRLRRETQYLALAFRARGLVAGKSIGIVAESCPEWIMADVATQLNQAKVVPLFPNISAENFNYQCDDASVQVLVLNKLSDLEPAIGALMPRFNAVICIDKHSELPANGVYWEDLVKEGEMLSRDPESSHWLNQQMHSLNPDDVFSILYTSGSTGIPKGVELTHRNMLSQIQVIKRDYLRLNVSTDVCLVVLPVAHAFERMSVYFYTLSGTKVYFADSPRHTAEIIREISPTVMTVVPRILERLYETMTAAGEKICGIQKLVFDHAIALAKRRNPLERRGVLCKIYDKLVYSKMREAMGGRFRLVISGGGALNKTICRFLLNVGFDVCEGYGLTECSPVVSVNRPGSARPGSVGQPLTHLQVKIGDHSEVLVKGDSVFKGYRNRPDLNAEIFTEDGFFRTGVQGYFDRDGFLYLTGRLKELLKTSTGKYVSPNPIELELGRHLLIEQALVVANDRKFASALIFLNPVNAKRFLKRTGNDFNLEKALKSRRIRESISRHVERVNSKLNHWEQIRKWTLIGDELTVESGLLTPTLKIRRSVAEARFAEEIEKMYEEASN
jgi:long-chain acyl-CoA synthetase